MTAGVIELFAIGVAAGAFGALLGIGGGAILVPALALAAGLPLRAAVATSLVCVVATSVAGSAVYLWQDRVELPVAMELQWYTVLGAVAAGVAAVRIPPGPLFLAFAGLLLAIALRMWPRPTPRPTVAPARKGGRPLAATASVGAGILAGLLGVGGGILNVPVLHLVLRVPFDRAVPTSVCMLGVTAAAAAAVYVARGDVDAFVVSTAMLGTLAGAGVAAAAGRRVSPRLLQAVFALVLLYTAFQMGRRGLAEL